MNPHTIWKYHSRNIIIAISLACGTSNAACPQPNPGIYVKDNTANARFDGGKLERILSVLTPSGLSKSAIGTTAQVGLAITLGAENHIYTTIGNEHDDKYENLSIRSPLDIGSMCEQITIQFEVEKYYPDYIKINELPKKKPLNLPQKMKASLEGEIIDSNTILIKKCSAYNFDKKLIKWEKEEDYSPLCPSKREYKLFNITEHLKNKPGWSVK